MMRILRLGEVCEKIGSGATPRGGSEVYLSSGITLIRSQNIYNDRFDRNGLAFIGEQHAEELSNVEVKFGDVLLNITGDSVARVFQVPDDVLPARVNQHVAIIRPRENILNARYLRYYLASPFMQAHMLALASAGATRNALTKGMIASFEIPAPPLATQRAIAHILGTLDDKIELNRRTNETLEAMTRALFKSWFVDFDPVKQKPEGRKQLAGLDAETAALFPDSFEDSALGKVPRGWKVQNLGQHLEAEKGLSYKGEGLSKDGGMPMHNLNSVYEGGGYKHEGIKYYTADYKERHLLHPSDIIVTNTEQGFDYLLIGYPAIVPKHFGDKGIFTHHIFRVRPLPESPAKSHFVYYLLMSPLVRDQIIGFTNGTTVNMLSADGLRMPAFVLPPAELIDRFEEIARPVFEKKEQLHEESHTLTALRDALLPKLMSGEVRVGEAEKVLESTL